MSSGNEIRPVFSVNDLPAAQEYYENSLGFAAIESWGDPKTCVVLKRGTATIALYGPGTPSSPAIPSFAAVFVDNLEDVAAHLTENGAKIQQPLVSRPDGYTDIQVADPDGNLITFSRRAAS